MKFGRFCLAVAVLGHVLCLVATSFSQVEEKPKNITHDWAKSRQKRFLIFPTQAAHKITHLNSNNWVTEPYSRVSSTGTSSAMLHICPDVSQGRGEEAVKPTKWTSFLISLALTIDLGDKTAWRSLSGAWNFQWQHMLPLTVLHWWNSTYFPAKSRSITGTATLPLSLSSSSAATATASQEPTDLTATFLYAMIENYMNNKGMNGRECLQRAICENAQVHFVGGVLDHVYKRLLTPERSMEEYYKDSFTMGSKGADCLKTFYGCPKGESVFDHFVRMEDVE